MSYERLYVRLISGGAYDAVGTWRCWMNVFIDKLMEDFGMEYRQNDWSILVWGVCGSEKGWQCGYEGNRVELALCHCAWRELF